MISKETFVYAISCMLGCYVVLAIPLGHRFVEVIAGDLGSMAGVAALMCTFVYGVGLRVAAGSFANPVLDPMRGLLSGLTSGAVMALMIAVDPEGNLGGGWMVAILGSGIGLPLAANDVLGRFRARAQRRA